MAGCRTNSLCIFCYKPISAFDESHESNCSPEFLQFFSRFLKIPLTIRVQNQDDYRSDLVSCDDCFELGESFRNLFFQWEALRLQLEWRVRELFEIMRSAGKVSARVNEFKKQFQFEEDDEGDSVYCDIQKLRKEILSGCTKKLNTSFPRVVLDRIPEQCEKVTRNVPSTVKNFEIMERFMTFIAVFQLSLPESVTSKGNHDHRKVKKYWRVDKEVQTCAFDDADDYYQHEHKDDLPPATATPPLVEANFQPLEAEVSVSPEVTDLEIYDSVGEVSENIHQYDSEGDVYEERQLDAERNHQRDDSFSLEIISETAAFEATKAVSVLSPTKAVSPVADKLTTCYICQMTFSTPVLLTHHIRTFHHLQVPFECPHCDHQILQTFTFRHHMKNVHKTGTGLPGLVECEICRERFPTVHAVRIHKSRVHKQPTRDLKERNWTQRPKFQSWGTKLKLRLRRSRPRPTPRTTASLRENVNSLRIPCPICQVPSNDQEALSTHMRLAHQKILAYECAHCTMKLKTMEGVRSHMYFIHGKLFKTTKTLLSANNISYSCTDLSTKDDAPSQHGMEWSLVGDEDHHHSSSSSETAEEESSASPPRPINDQEPQPGPSTSTMSPPGTCNISKIDEKAYPCQWKGCTMKFSKKDALKLHYPKHTRTAPFRCTICQLSFFGSSFLSRHMKIHGVEGKFKCNFEGCLNSYANKCSLQAHQRTHTPAKTLWCGWQRCTRKFLSTEGLKRHYKLHTITTPFQCLPCQLSFLNSFRLKLHLSRHHHHRVVPVDIDIPNDLPAPEELSGETFDEVEAEIPSTNSAPGRNSKTSSSLLKMYKCNFGGWCDPTFESLKSWKSHQRIHSEKKNQCMWQGCSFTFGSVEELKQHYLQNHSSEQLPKKKHNQQHQASVGKPTSKQIIILDSDTEDNMQETEVAEHGHQPLVKYNCTPCGKQIGTSTEFVAHMFKIHKKVLQVRDEEQLQQLFQVNQTSWKYVCPTVGCLMRFSSKEELMLHFETHTQSVDEERELEMMEVDTIEENVSGEVEREYLEAGSNETAGVDLQPPEGTLFNDPVPHFAASVVPTNPVVPEPSPSPRLEYGMEVEDVLYFLCAHCPFETGDQGELQAHLDTHNQVNGNAPEAGISDIASPYHPNSVFTSESSNNMVMTSENPPQLEAHQLEHGNKRQNPVGWEECVMAIFKIHEKPSGAPSIFNGNVEPYSAAVQDNNDSDLNVEYNQSIEPEVDENVLTIQTSEQQRATSPAPNITISTATEKDSSLMPQQFSPQRARNRKCNLKESDSTYSKRKPT